MTPTTNPGSPAVPVPPLPGATGRGTATGGLGTAANLDDTQQFSLEDLGLVPEPEPHPAGPLAPRRRRVRGSRRGAGTLVPVLALLVAGAVLLTIRDGGPLAAGQLGGIPGQGDAGPGAGSSLPADFFAILPTQEPATAAPAPTEDGGKQKGKGNGNGRGRGNGNDPVGD